MYGGHPNEDFLESLRHQAPHLKKVIYLAYKQDGHKVLQHSGLYFHDVPSAQDLIDANVIRGGRKVMFLTYEDDYNEQIALDGTVPTKKRTLTEDDDENHLPKTKKPKQTESSGSSSRAVPVGLPPPPSTYSGTFARGRYVPHDQQASGSSARKVHDPPPSSPFREEQPAQEQPPGNSSPGKTNPAPAMWSGGRLPRRQATTDDLLLKKIVEMKEHFPQFVTFNTDSKMRVLYKDVSFCNYC